MIAIVYWTVWREKCKIKETQISTEGGNLVPGETCGGSWLLEVKIQEGSPGFDGRSYVPERWNLWVDKAD